MDTNPFSEVTGHWEEVIEDMEATAAEYRKAGWEIVELHPGDVAVLDDERHGFDVLVPDNEFDQLAPIVDDASFAETEVYHAEGGGIVFVLAVVLDTEREVGICCPLYYDTQRVGDLYRHVEQTGQLVTYIRTLSDDRSIAITHDDPTPFFPEPAEPDE